ncbi:unnamed protein product [Bursaphelenchus xylophilus]|uniref:(pine wood nematode) hypothetical protein n=1 Tax=Bursaphelenchus xylophilus TaxID=6326 RepID=A0A1I7S0G8_BURXY|nr:unnamed protein product [Bursaphelenchus xylophilus]CAD5235714.1 unnamed protein product [Bursaphelenchus xylophilus]CAG9132250.1 unnamed protein product [Bursaphelenchus xylophilus]CAG9132251.1 unnamed protein product [Bursaphelenchus xylophilus]
MKAPGWRPTFKCFHWTLSLAGALLCLIIMFISNWKFAILAIAMGVVVYKYIELKGAEKEWGDGLGKNIILGIGGHSCWCCMHIRCFTASKRIWMRGEDDLLGFVSQLNAGKGLRVVIDCIEGVYGQKAKEACSERQALLIQLQEHKIKGFAEVIVAENYNAGVDSLVQTSTLGDLRHNTVCWPNKWTSSKSTNEANRFVSVLCSIATAKCAILEHPQLPRIEREIDRHCGCLVDCA